MHTQTGWNPTRRSIFCALGVALIGTLSLVLFASAAPVDTGNEINTTDEPQILSAVYVPKGTTIIRDAKELRVKESDRIQSIVDELNRMGGHLEATPDGLIIQGPVSLTGQACHSYGDHRIAMAIAIAGLIAKGETTIDQSECASISYPGFWKELAELDNNGGTTDGT